MDYEEGGGGGGGCGGGCGSGGGCPKEKSLGLLQTAPVHQDQIWRCQTQCFEQYLLKYCFLLQPKTLNRLTTSPTC